MLQIISRKFTVALIAMTIFSLAFALVGYTSSSEEYNSFGSLFGMFVVFSAPQFIVVGSIASFLIDRYFKWKRFEILAYAVIGALAMIPFTLYIFNNGAKELALFMLYGAIAAILYYGVKWVLNRVFPNAGF